MADGAFDKEGFLQDLDTWDRDMAEEIARAEDIRLTAEHWEIIELARRFYREFESSPANRALVKYAAQQLGPDKGRSIYLMGLFPGSAAKLASKIAGLPKPDNCL